MRYFFFLPRIRCTISIKAANVKNDRQQLTVRFSMQMIFFFIAILLAPTTIKLIARRCLNFNDQLIHDLPFVRWDFSK